MKYFKILRLTAIITSIIVYLDTLIVSLMSADAAVYYIANLGVTDHRLPVDNLEGLIDLIWLIGIPLAIGGSFSGKTGKIAFVIGAAVSLLRGASFLWQASLIPTHVDAMSQRHFFVNGLLALTSCILWIVLWWQQCKQKGESERSGVSQ